MRFDALLVFMFFWL